jgi:hypothetical protein
VLYIPIVFVYVLRFGNEYRLSIFPSGLLLLYELIMRLSLEVALIGSTLAVFYGTTQR